MRSKYITIPDFSHLPRTNAADVTENIDLWLDSGQQDKVEKFLRPFEQGYRGYRFINSSDLKEEKTLQWVVNRTIINVRFTRYAKSWNFTPLWFNVDKITIQFNIDGTDNWFYFKSDTNLKRIIQDYKNIKKIC